MSFADLSRFSPPHGMERKTAEYIVTVRNTYWDTILHRNQSLNRLEVVFLKNKNLKFFYRLMFKKSWPTLYIKLLYKIGLLGQPVSYILKACHFCLARIKYISGSAQGTKISLHKKLINCWSWFYIKATLYWRSRL